MKEKSISSNITNQQHVFIIGSKGIPAKYGGFETFVDKLTEYQVDKSIKYHIACLGKNSENFEYNGASCFNINVPDIGSGKAIYYDIMALKKCIQYCKQRPEIQNPIFYILACRIGPFIIFFKKQIEKLNGMLYINPDGHEWKRAKWNRFIRKYWKISEKLMVKQADLIICDSKSIEKYIQKNYHYYTPKTVFIAYGSDTKKSSLKNDDKQYQQWLKEKEAAIFEYYLVVGRFVPENNYEIMIREFMKSKTKKNFILVTNVSEKFLNELKDKTTFDKDSRIKFVGTVYNHELLKKIRENAYGYFHGHEVGGTNPSLLEAMGSTNLNLLLDVSFNREVGEDAVLYWNKNEGNLAKLIDEADNLSAQEIKEIGIKAKKRIQQNYSWNRIIDSYEKVFKNQEIFL